MTYQWYFCGMLEDAIQVRIALVCMLQNTYETLYISYHYEIIFEMAPHHVGLYLEWLESAFPLFTSGAAMWLRRSDVLGIIASNVINYWWKYVHYVR